MMAADREVRVVTMNLWGTRGQWEERRRVLADGLRELSPDLLTLQETIVTDRYDQVHDLLGDAYHVVHQTDRESDGQGVSIASRWALSEVRELDLHVSERTADFACTTMLTRVGVPFGPLLLVNHFPSWKPHLEAEREAQAVIAARAIEETAGPETHVILAGDLDADPTAASIRFFTGRQSLDGVSVCYRDTWESIHPDTPGHTRHTFTPINELMVDTDWPFRRIDYIFDQPRDGVWASDHFGLVADLAFDAA